MARKYRKVKFDLTKALRKAGISQYELAKRLGKPASDITKMKKAEYNPTLKTLNKLAKTMDLEVSDLLN